ncbi:lactonase family protein [Phytoactinopolyspora halotolerans]|uniref:Lactonase family protein n=1 Tax=Phytoactinopolyspora halotolerans TaxID=1981512 RepID=A0A6L9SBL3_9ACTN|nr:lactonase family protein [Phytoactinopolyspora halotolerans]NEE01898.1 lactonase family protein [Phytoactinopolyspora halotolerans]
MIRPRTPRLRKDGMYAYVGGTAIGSQGGPATGISIIELDGAAAATRTLTAAEAIQPMYMALSPDRRTLYATQATADGRVSSWTVGDGRRLTALGDAKSSGGGVPCHLSVHPAGTHLLTANYATGTVAVHPINDDGSLGEASHVLRHDGSGPHERQGAAHPHMITTDPVTAEGRGHVLAVDLGTDTIYRYHLDLDTGRLAEHDHIHLPDGTGPRHIVVRGGYGYVVGELASTLTVIDLTTSPAQPAGTVSTHVTGGDRPSLPSAVRLSADGSRAYVLNRGPDTIATFAVNGPDVALISTVDAEGEYPWDALLRDGHLYVVNQRSSSLTTFAIDAATGIPGPVGVVRQVRHPVCILPADPDGS